MQCYLLVRRYEEGWGGVNLQEQVLHYKAMRVGVQMNTDYRYGECIVLVQYQYLRSIMRVLIVILIAFRDDITAESLDNQNSNCEIVWTKIH